MTRPINPALAKLQLQQGLRAAHAIEEKLAQDVLVVEKDNVRLTYKGTGEPIAIELRPDVTIEEIKNAMIEGYWTCAKHRDARVDDLTGVKTKAGGRK
jgi:hypothetical protein